VDFKKILAGLQSFAKFFRGKLNTETMLINGYNDNTDHLYENAKFIATIKPDKSYISIPTRPPAIKGITPVTSEKITEAWQIYQKEGLKTELLIGFEGTNTGFTGNAFNDILNITTVHPLREDTMEKLLEQNNASFSVVDSLIELKLIKKIKYNEKTYYLRDYHY
jgi:wyosine [tRNA(Phe)-imidazoG37] synthetase (radical SAM superfamily)